MGVAAKAGLIFLTVLFFTMGARAQEAEPPTPPLIPEDEQAVPDDPDFIERCMAHVPKALGIEIAATLTTQSDQWELVWRADFNIPKTARTIAVNRIVCKRERGDQPLNFALATGQNIPSLAPK